MENTSNSRNPETTLQTYQVFPGIQLKYCNVHTQSLNQKERKDMPNHFFEISYCWEGRLEYNLNDEFCYLTSGDLAITQTNQVSQIIYFPLRHYHGITISIDLCNTPECLSCFLDDVNVEPKALAKKFCTNEQAFIARSNPSVQHIFSELYSVPAEVQKGYFKVKVLELLLFLSVFDVERDEFGNRSYTESQARLAREIERYLTEHIEDRITLKEISAHFHVSETHIKNTFKSVYGASPYAFIREQKMESAAYMLEYTDKSILEIAGIHGYDNGSKFASAFRSVKGITPNEYRNGCHRKK